MLNTQQRIDLLLKKTKMFGLNFWAVKLKEAAIMILESVKAGEKVLVVTPNVDHIVLLEKDKEARQIFQNAKFVFADGMPLVWLSRILQRTNPLLERVTGTDLLPILCGAASTKDLTVAFIGGKPGAAEMAGRVMAGKYPGLKVVGSYCPHFGFEYDATETQNILSLLSKWKPDFLFLGVGTPKQEKWAATNWANINAGAVLCVGAAIEFAAGLVDRAPLWMQKAGLEWFWRLLKEPRRMWRRYLIRDIAFFKLALREIVKVSIRAKSNKEPCIER